MIKIKNYVKKIKIISQIISLYKKIFNKILRKYTLINQYSPSKIKSNKNLYMLNS
jgi:hypothetical protein